MYAKVRNLLLVTALCAGLFWVSGAFGEQNTYVIDLDGNGDFISTPDADNLTDFANGSFTLQAWIFCQNLNVNRPIASKLNTVGDQRSWAFLVTPEGYLRLRISSDGTAAGTSEWQTTYRAVNSDAWVHVAAVCDPLGADKIKFYANNVEYVHGNTGVNPPTSIFNSTVDMWVGRYISPAGGNQYFFGYIDEVRLTEGVLTSFPYIVLDFPLTATSATDLLYHFNEVSGAALDHGVVGGNPSNDGTFNGNAARRSWDGMGEGNDLPLPVTLVALAAAGGDAAVTVSWITESEIDNLGYYLYRSTNDLSGYSRITTSLIPSLGFSASTQNYQYVDDRELINGVTYYYKISDVDVNGRERQHEVIAAATPVQEVMLPGESSSLADYQLSQNYPNPFNASTQIRYYVRNSGAVRLAVYDLSGNQVSLLIDQVQSAGEHFYEFDASPLPSGIYFIRLTGENGYDNIKKMLFLK